MIEFHRRARRTPWSAHWGALRGALRDAFRDTLRRAAVAAAAAASLLPSGCEQTVVSVVEVATVEVAPPRILLMEGTSTEASVTLRESGGRELHGRSIQWSTGDTAVAAVSPAGVVEARAAGSTWLRARSEGVAGNAEITVLAIPPPRIGVSDRDVTLSGIAGWGGTAIRVLSVRNEGEGRLWGLEVAVLYADERGAEAAWLAASLGRSRAPTTLTLRASARDLPAGVHRAELRISSPAAANSPQAVRVRFVVGEPPLSSSDAP